MRDVLEVGDVSAHDGKDVVDDLIRFDDDFGGGAWDYIHK